MEPRLGVGRECTPAAGGLPWASKDAAVGMESPWVAARRGAEPPQIKATRPRSGPPRKEQSAGHNAGQEERLMKRWI